MLNRLGNKLQAYWLESYRHLVAIALIWAVAINLPPFKLFEERSNSMVQVHLLLELFAFMVAGFLAIVAWHDLRNRSASGSGVILFGSSLVAMLDLVHALAYDGMPPFLVDNSSTRSIFFWLMGRTMVILTILAVLLQVRINLSRQWWLGFSVMAALALIWIGSYRIDWLPSLFVPGQGVSIFKRNFEYALLVSDILLAFFLIFRSTDKNKELLFPLASSCLIMGIGETLFTSYVTSSDFTNIFGHGFKIISYWFLYRCAYIAAVQHPYRKLQESQTRFKALTELSSDWYWEQDANFRFTQVNTQSSETPSDLFLGKARWELPLPDNALDPMQGHRRVAENHEPYRNFEYPVRSDSGEIIWISASGFPVFSENGQFQGYRGVSSDITQRKKAEHQVEFLAYHDALTGLPNRLRLEERFAEATDLVARSGQKIALIYLDLDEFKSINDSMGHEIGDTLLRQVAARLHQSIRSADILCRQGGDEFLILLPAIETTSEVVTVLDKILASLQQPFLLSAQEVTTTASIGAAIFPNDGRDLDTLRQHADVAMYRAKEQGRNSYRFFDDFMTNEAIEYLSLRNGLRKALEMQELALHYQPQINLKTGAIVGVEALLRWTHPSLGAISPARFIPVAEKSGYIVDIGKWVFREACKQAVQWQEAGLPALRMAINLSAVQFKRDDLVSTVRSAIEESGLRPGLLELELTESILIKDADIALTVIKNLKKLGVEISLDDFGTGYSSLAYLKRFDIDKLKIDQSFVRNLDTNQQDAAIARAIIHLAQDLGLSTIAEGVETQDVLDRLQALGCHEAQGYLFSRPVAAEMITKLLREQEKSGQPK